MWVDTLSPIRRFTCRSTAFTTSILGRILYINAALLYVCNDQKSNITRFCHMWYARANFDLQNMILPACIRSFAGYTLRGSKPMLNLVFDPSPTVARFEPRLFLPCDLLPRCVNKCTFFFKSLTFFKLNQSFTKNRNICDIKSLYYHVKMNLVILI
jgi:hypothetical protein